MSQATRVPTRKILEFEYHNIQFQLRASLIEFYLIYK